jgi:hypothetical protein
MMVTTCNRLQVAQNILACAATGERDPIELGIAALINAKLAVDVATGFVRRQQLVGKVAGSDKYEDRGATRALRLMGSEFRLPVHISGPCLHTGAQSVSATGTSGWSISR